VAKPLMLGEFCSSAVLNQHITLFSKENYEQNEISDITPCIIYLAYTFFGQEFTCHSAL
jgi:hypothetical protein